MRSTAMTVMWIDEHIAAWNSHSPERVVTFMNDDATYEDLTLGIHCQGRDEIEQFAIGLETGFSSDYRFEITNSFATDDVYAIEWTLQGTNDRSSPARNLPATGKPYSVRGASIGSLQCDKIHRNRDYWNLAGMLMQVGLMPHSPAPGS
jgi:steroid delta-isomerase-like uncharacterized protein